MSRNSAELVGQVYNLSQWAYGPQKYNENQATLPNEDFALVVAKSRACPTPTVGAGHARRPTSQRGLVLSSRSPSFQPSRTSFAAFSTSRPTFLAAFSVLFARSWAVRPASRAADSLSRRVQPERDRKSTRL